MVHLTSTNYGTMKTFALLVRGKKFNHRIPIRYQRFRNKINPEEIVEHYSRDDIDKINPRAGERTYKDAQLTLGRKNILLPNLSAQDLELNELYQRELDRQRAIISRINKIRVFVDSKPGNGTELLVNEGISTPNDCASHIHELLTTRSVVAEVTLEDSSPHNANSKEVEEVDQILGETEGKNENGKQLATIQQQKASSIYWDMHRPLLNNCRIKFRHFAEKDVSEVNKIYWRSCSFILGMAIRLAFKDQIKVLLHSWPKPNIQSGSFVYDLALNLSDKWEPTEQELRAFTKIMWDIKNQALPFDRLQVDREVARKLFSNNMFKLDQIDSILGNESSQGKITVYRCGGLLDISVGPMIANTSQIGRITLAAVHPFETQSEQHKGVFYRFQGVSLPQQLPLSSFLYQNLLINHAKKLNKASL